MLDMFEAGRLLVVDFEVAGLDFELAGLDVELTGLDFEVAGLDEDVAGLEGRPAPMVEGRLLKLEPGRLSLKGFWCEHKGFFMFQKPIDF